MSDFGPMWGEISQIPGPWTPSFLNGPLIGRASGNQTPAEMIKLIMIVVVLLTWASVKMVLMIDINFINIITTSMMMLVCPHIRQMTAVSLGTDIRHLSLPLSTPHSGPLPLSLSSLSSFIIKFFPQHLSLLKS